VDKKQDGVAVVPDRHKNGVAVQTDMNKTYRPSDKEPFMNERQREYFRDKLLAWREDILKVAKETLQHLHDENQNHADFADRASSETDRAIELRAGDLIGADGGWEVVLAGDISYERDMAEAATAWLKRLAVRGAEVWIGDPGRSYLARDSLECIVEYLAPVSRALEDAEVKRSGVYRFRL